MDSGWNPQVGRNLHIGADPAIPVPPGATPAQGTLSTDNGSVISVGNAVYVHPGGQIQFQNAGTSPVHPRAKISAPAGLFNAGLIQGYGILDANVSNSGSLRPQAASMGAFEVTGNFTQADGALLYLTLSKSAPVDQFLLDGTGNIDGTIQLSLLDPANVHVGDQLRLVRSTAGGTIVCTADIFGAGFQWMPVFVPGSGLYAQVTAVPEPSASAFVLLTFCAFWWRFKTRSYRPSSVTSSAPVSGSMMSP
jgi:hypothetical protein